MSKEWKSDKSVVFAEHCNTAATSEVASIRQLAHAQSEKQLAPIMARIKEQQTRPTPQTTITGEVVPHIQTIAVGSRSWFSKHRFEGESAIAYENRQSEIRQRRREYNRRAKEERIAQVRDEAIRRLAATLGEDAYIDPKVAATPSERRMIAVTSAVGAIDGNKRVARTTDKGLQSNDPTFHARNAISVGLIDPTTGKLLTDSEGRIMRVTVQRTARMTRNQSEIVDALTNHFRPFSTPMGRAPESKWKGGRFLPAVKAEDYYSLPVSERSKAIPTPHVSTVGYTYDAKRGDWIPAQRENFQPPALSGNGGTQSERKSSRRVGSIVVQPSERATEVVLVPTTPERATRTIFPRNMQRSYPAMGSQSAYTVKYPMHVHVLEVLPNRAYPISDHLRNQRGSLSLHVPPVISPEAKHGKHVHGGSMPIPATFQHATTPASVSLTHAHPPILYMRPDAPCAWEGGAYCEFPRANAVSVRNVATATATANA